MLLFIRTIAVVPSVPFLLCVCTPSLTALYSTKNTHYYYYIAVKLYDKLTVLSDIEQKRERGGQHGLLLEVVLVALINNNL